MSPWNPRIPMRPPAKKLEGSGDWRCPKGEAHHWDLPETGTGERYGVMSCRKCGESREIELVPGELSNYRWSIKNRPRKEEA